MNDKINIFPLEKISDENASYLTEILNNDLPLRNALKSTSYPISNKEYFDYCFNWSISRNAEIFTIILDKIAIGTISLSHQDNLNNSARIGYWIGSKYWGKGYLSLAFRQIIEYARKKKIVYVSATIEINNFASKKIWEKQGAKFEIKDSKYKAFLKI